MVQRIERVSHVIDVQIDEQQILEIAREEIKTKLKSIEAKFVFSDLKHLYVT